MELWVLLSLAGGALQAFRVAGQRLLAKASETTRVGPSDWASPFARVVVGLPVAAIALLVSVQHYDESLLPLIQGGHLGQFWFWVFVVAWLQMLATVIQTRLVARRNFALGVMYVKVLIPAMAVIGVLFFGDTFSLWEWCGIGVGTAGLVLMSYGKIAGQADLAWDWTTVGLGLGAGLVLACTGLSAREAVQALPHDSLGPITRGIAGLVCMALVQVVTSAVLIGFRDPREFLDLIDRWRPVLYTSLFSVAASLCWFMAFPLANPALINLVGQSEFFFALGISVLFFRDWPTRGEMLGMCVMALAIAIVLVF